MAGASTGHENLVSCEQIAQLRNRQVSQTVTEMFSPFPSDHRARGSDSADLPLPRSQPAGSRSFFVSATSIVVQLQYHISFSLTSGKIHKKQLCSPFFLSYGSHLPAIQRRSPAGTPFG